MSDLSLLKSIRRKHKDKKIGLCHGVYDIFHHGHLLHLKNSKTLCDILVISITEDKFVNKGPGRPYHSEYERYDILKSIKEIHLDLLLFLSNCYAGLKCQYLANKETSSLIDLKRCISSILS